MWVPLGDIPECSHNVTWVHTTHGLSKLRSKDLLFTWSTHLVSKSSWFLVTCLLDLKSPFPMCYVILFFSLLGSLGTGRQMNLRTWQVVLLLWFLFVSVCVCEWESYFWCLLVWTHQGVGPWLCSWYSSFPGEGPGTWWAPSKYLLTEGLLMHICGKLMRRLESG